MKACGAALIALSTLGRLSVLVADLGPLGTALRPLKLTRSGSAISGTDRFRIGFLAIDGPVLRGALKLSGMSDGVLEYEGL